MTDQGSFDSSRPKMEGVYETARAITVYGTPIILALMGLYMVYGAFGKNSTVGFRSLAGILLPVVVGSFLYVFNKDFLLRIGAVPTGVGFSIGLGLGILVMITLRLLDRGFEIPLGELILSGCFSVLIFSSAAGPEGKSLSYYYGVMCGLLVYIILLGFPFVN